MRRDGSLVEIRRIGDHLTVEAASRRRRQHWYREFLQHNDDPHTLLRYADTATYATTSDNTGAIYARDFIPIPRAICRLGELRRAVEEGELILHYQPKVDVRAGRAAHVEALVRRQHPERGVIHRDVGQHRRARPVEPRVRRTRGIPSFTTLASAGV